MIILNKKLYHGFPNIIEKPIFGHGKAYDDYGIGFYCTDVPEMAKERGIGRDCKICSVDRYFGTLFAIS